MRFEEMIYERPDKEALRSGMMQNTERLKTAGDYQEAKDAFLAMDRLNRHVHTLSALAYIRHSIDTRDPFYDGEMKFWNAVKPELEEYVQAFNTELLQSRFRPQLAEEFGEVVFINLELENRSFSPAIIPFM
ncbi:MAG: M3 family oligoendopeptidase, partial [Eubacteriales bacterium]|nr:M3 family oligoendopeptidase [Eubacteriales bacterium]